MLSYFYKFINRFIGHLSVNRCICCLNYISWRDYFCQQCSQSLPFYYVAPTFAQQLPYIDAIYCGLFYQFPIKELISKFKFLSAYNIGIALSEILLKKIEANQIKPQALLYVPMHHKKLYHRGFNQSLFIARYLAKKLKIPLLQNHIKKIKNTQNQHKSNKLKRKDNLKGAFKIIKKIDYNHIAIIDDVLTTGSTITELAKLIKEQASNKIIIEAWVLARTVN